MVKITLKRGKQESLLRRHPWVFSGAIQSSSADVEDGMMVDVYSSTDDFLARGHCGLGSIAVRVLSFEDVMIDAQWWEGRLRAALELRRVLGLVESSATNCYRLVHGEGDGLPGLVVDIYGSVAVMQAHSLGMYLEREVICAALRAVYGDRLTAVYDKSRGTLPAGSVEEIEVCDGYLWRSSLDADQGGVMEGGYRFDVSWEHGQKTGFFIDQRENRALLARYCAGARVLNTFCYTGGFSVYALGSGAVSVDSVDSSARAVELVQKNVELNFGSDSLMAGGVSAHVGAHRAICGDAIDFVRNLSGGEYDVIVLDPPAFAKNHKVLGNALQGYKRLNAKAIAAIAPGGVLFTFSCSQAVSADQFRTAVFSAAAIAGRNVRILHKLTQPADHPINIYHPEGEYLKGLVLYVE